MLADIVAEVLVAPPAPVIVPLPVAALMVPGPMLLLVTEPPLLPPPLEPLPVVVTAAPPVILDALLVLLPPVVTEFALLLLLVEFAALELVELLVTAELAELWELLDGPPSVATELLLGSSSAVGSLTTVAQLAIIHSAPKLQIGTTLTFTRRPHALAPPARPRCGVWPEATFRGRLNTCSTTF